MDIRQLKCFVEIARHRNFTKAAEALNIAQPAISMAIQKLEGELESILFNRRNRRVALTAEGEIFLAHANRILEALEAAHQEMADLKGLRNGEVRLGIPPMMSTYFFPAIIHEFKRLYPHLQLAVSGEGAGSIQRKINQGELDMGVIAGGQVPESLEVRHILREEVVACIPAGHPFASRGAITLREFAAQPLIMFKQGYYQREMLLELLHELPDVQPRVVFETNLFSLVKSLVKRGLGLATLLKMVAEDDRDLQAVSFDPPLYLDLMLAWKKGAYLSHANKAFVDFLMAQLQLYGGRR
ncbi:MAG: LysR family transcriptional regulator [Desulfobulbus sp.]|jgi:DNA-binding transcriptional LysR family regulator|uniref:LysR family transcriptional regulator n=1 Tax=Desulfobulbus sp. TaxID=895 RepID=UPI002851E73C|nr:LysR family transcriptional regulator [Desulfobulbus sp.]MDR2548896.1 LysR family transcriptional regulator [Desulfobulbus sp.]